MIVLDTNVISELMKQAPEPRVVSWLESGQEPLYLSVIAIAEIMRGIARLPEGKKKDALNRNFGAFANQAFQERILSFDESAAKIYGSLACGREKSGLKADAVDMMIAATAKSRDAAIATRNIRDFEQCGIRLINPWEEGQGAEQIDPSKS